MPRWPGPPLTDEEKRAKAAAWQREYRRRNPGVIRRNNLKAKWDLTPEAYDALLVAQGGVCAVCRLPEESSNQFGPSSLCVDHDHSTGRIRGLLCHPCNRAEGLLNKSPDNVRRMLDYLERAV